VLAIWETGCRRMALDGELHPAVEPYMPVIQAPLPPVAVYRIQALGAG
jgi:hypothetical protein